MRKFTRSSAILILVLLLHALLVYIILRKRAQPTMPWPINQDTESAFVFIAPDEAAQSAITPTPPTPVDSQQHQITPQETQPAQKVVEDKPQVPPEDLLFASLYQKETEPETEEILDAPNETAPIKDDTPLAEDGTLTEATELVTEQEKKETPLTPESIAPQKVSKPPRDVATDDIPMAFEGVHTTTLSDRDSLFHTFIKAVNTALYNSMQQDTPPFTPGSQPVIVRLVITRTGRLAQRPTIVRSSGNASRDAWYIMAIERGSLLFPPIPAALKLPFAEFMFKEGTRGHT